MFVNKYLISRLPFAPLFALMVGFLLTGCDSNETTSGTVVIFQGRVTEAPGFGKRAALEGAVVTAANLHSDGSLSGLQGEATTDAQGNFSLDAEGAADMVVLTAEKDAFRSEVLVTGALEGGGTIRTMPMTTESEAEAEAYVESTVRGFASDLVTAADVAAYVNETLAAEWKGGGTTTAEIVAALEASSKAEEKYYRDADDTEVDADKVRKEKRMNFLTLQADLSASVGTSAQKEAITAFERAMVSLYTDAGVSMETEAKARQAGRAAMIKFFVENNAQARFALRQQAEILASLATAQAIEERFKAEGASSARLNALAQFRSALVLSLRAASSESDLESAQASYNSSVQAEVMAEIGVDAVLLAGVETALTTAKATLDASVGSAGSAGAVASAYATFYTTAEASAKTSLASTENAELGAKVLTLLSVQ
ncbi:MAG: carboxypeptidase-like regulatory domain-containing protein [Rhodothermales bacterium]